MSERLLILWRAWPALAALAVAGPGFAQALDPFRTPNLNPASAILGLPVWAGVPESTTVGLTTELANHYRFSETGGDALMLDGETLRVRAYVDQPLGDRWSVGIDLPYVRQSGGVLDNLVDAWHSAFHLPDGGRNDRPENLLEFALADANGRFYRLDRAGAGFGDVRLSLAGRFGGKDGWVVRGTLKLATGDERLLAGSGATDVTLSALRRRTGTLRDRAAGFYYGAALMDPGQPENVRYPVEARLLAAIFGGGMSLTERFGIKGQLELNTPPYDSALAEIGRTAVQATFGVWRGIGESALFEFAVGEDLNVSTSPDVVLFFGLSWRIR